jgi:DNA invertase Pin-like site-specific DNA recombinase
MNTSDLIQPTHLQRRAIIYIRQSSPGQVLNHRESKRLQYALKDRALERGWQKCNIQVIDRDLGLTASTAADRPGFQELVSLVSLGQVGIVFAYDATRLARNCTDWYQLLDLCSLRQCLVGDQDGIYDSATPNSRLILGLKGMIAELELHTIRARLRAGKISKAERGELAIALPTGLVRLESGQVIKDPNREVQDRITLIFHTLLAQKSLAKVVRLFRDQQLKIPRRDKWGDIRWKPATQCALSDIVHNPAYAGAYVWGRSRWLKSPKTGRQQQVLLPREQWRVCLHDRFPAYLSWSEFESIEAMLRDNYAEYQRRRTRGVPREGKALLQGIAYCGECGHKLGVQYKKTTQYLCHFFRTHDYPGPPCQRLPADLVDEQVVHWFVEALAPAEIDLSARVLAEGDRTRDQVLAARRQEVERLQYQARLADRQFQRSDPDNRLVTAELERRWEEALRACQEAENRLREEEAHASCLAIPADLLEQLQDIGPHVSELWQQKLFKTSQKKALLRTLIDKVVLHRAATDRVCIRVVWRGGQTTTTELRVPVYSFARLSDGKQIEETIVRLARDGQTDEQIAAVLTAEGHRAPRNQEINAGMVRRLRLAKRVSRYRLKAHPLRRPGYLTLIEIAEKLKVSYARIYRYLFEGKLRATKDPSANCYLFPDKPATLAQFRQLLDGEISQLCF